MVLEIKKRESVNKRNNHDYKCSEHKQVADPVEILREYQIKQDQKNMAKANEILYMLSGDTTVMYGLLIEIPELVQKAKQVANDQAKYSELLELSQEYF